MTSLTFELKRCRKTCLAIFLPIVSIVNALYLKAVRK